MSRHLLLAWWPVIVSAVPVAVVGSAATTTSTVTEERRALDALEQCQQQHERLPGHPEEIARLRAVEIEVARSAQTAEAIQDRSREIDVNLALVAPPRARTACADR